MTHIVQGEDKSITITFSTSTGYLDLTGNTEITFRMPGRSGAVEKTKGAGAISVVGADTSGVISVTLTDTDTKALKDGRQSAEILIDYGTTRKIFQLKDEFSVDRRLT